jgi:tRNA nucleotidyltransferase (CCA-adding enzyme)
LKLIEGIDLFRRPERLQPFLLACEADARGRTGLEDKPYPQADIFRCAFEAAQSVDTATIAEQDKDAKGDVVGEKIRKARIVAIKKVL